MFTAIHTSMFQINYRFLNFKLAFVKTIRYNVY